MHLVLLEENQNILETRKRILNENSQMTKETEKGPDFFITQSRCSQSTERNNV